MDRGCSYKAPSGTFAPLEADSLSSRKFGTRCGGENGKMVSGIVLTPSTVLDLSKKSLQHLCDDIFKVPNLKQLHLQGNALCIIPKDFFQLLPNLVWLDLRNNKIKHLPSGIGTHKFLQTLLLERNPIKTLPVELGNLTSLKALNLRYCPLEFPPMNIVEKGLLAILAYLRQWDQEKCTSLSSASQDKIHFSTDEITELLKSGLDLSQERANKEGDTRFQKRNDKVTSKEKEDFFPVVEKLNLAELPESSLDLSEEWPSEEEIIRFKKLKQEMIQVEREFLDKQRLPIDPTSRLEITLKRNHGKEKAKKAKPFSRRKKSTRKNTFPELSSYEAVIQAKRTEESRLAAYKELKEKQALLEQRRRDQRILQEWRDRAKLMKMQREELSRLQPLQKDTAAARAPYATDIGSGEEKAIQLSGKKHLLRGMVMGKSVQETEEARAVRDRELAQRIHNHIRMMQERRDKTRGTPKEEMEKARQALEYANKLQVEVAQSAQNCHLEKEYRFTAYTGDPSHDSTPRSQPRNIFLNMKF
ncbi:leucine-rich repeat-containing protein 27 isoform X1 [Ornithorhynchus anatinus]|uniref:leucine-rich repeat-containing protein 27 isoform X1 n=1 Tax=Ornithorhynchus anatinus TaxID=9258 RepID=UPI0010A77631|nr:leucine-rich repeat-containing protein 27 isoform X1 [Ornithorhynchus anatinus]